MIDRGVLWLPAFFFLQLEREESREETGSFSQGEARH